MNLTTGHCLKLTKNICIIPVAIYSKYIIFILFFYQPHSWLNFIFSVLIILSFPFFICLTFNLYGYMCVPCKKAWNTFWINLEHK